MRRFLSILSLSTLVIANAAFAQSAVTGGHAGHHPADAATPSPLRPATRRSPAR